MTTTVKKKYFANFSKKIGKVVAQKKGRDITVQVLYVV
jgi:hypothetical protein